MLLPFFLIPEIVRSETLRLDYRVLVSLWHKVVHLCITVFHYETSGLDYRVLVSLWHKVVHLCITVFHYETSGLDYRVLVSLWHKVVHLCITVFHYETSGLDYRVLVSLWHKVVICEPDACIKSGTSTVFDLFLKINVALRQNYCIYLKKSPAYNNSVHVQKKQFGATLNRLPHNIQGRGRVQCINESGS